MALSGFWRSLTRRKVVDMRSSSPSTSDSSSSSPLARVLTTVDLTALGVGSTLGVGVYVLAGSVARDAAGPAVIISFAVAAIASIFAGLCYAEFGARVPLAGSAYIYSYVSIGEFMAFVIGWNLIMEYVIGCASVARGLSNYLDQLVNNSMQESFQSVAHLHVSFLSPYIDFFAFAISFLLSVVLAFGVKESMSLNNLFTAVNMAVVLFVIIAGAFKADIANWQIDPTKVTAKGVGKGGFFPFGVMGVLRGAATCFYGFIGFDCIATTGEEVKNPKRAIPLSIILSLVIIFLAYFGVSSVLTLMWPYYLQDPDAPLPFVFHEVGWPLAQWIVAIGGIFGLFASLFGAMYPLPRVIYAMATDGLIFKFLGDVHPKYKTPLVGTLLAGIITGLMAALFKLEQLVAMLSFGTLVAYTIVAACVLLLRYSICETADMQGDEEAVSLLSDSEKLTDDIYRSSDSDDMGVAEYKETTNLVSLKDKPTMSKLFSQIFNSHGLKKPTAVTSRLVSILVVVFCGLCVALGLCLVHMEEKLMYGSWSALSLVCVISSLLLIVVLSMALQPTSSRELPFKVPWVPVIPALSILLNIYLIVMSDLNTCIRFSIWMAIGVGLYFIALACHALNWCGSPLALHAPPSKTSLSSGTSTIRQSNGVLHLNGSFEFGPVKSVQVGTEMCQNENSLMHEKSVIEVKILCATPMPSDSSSVENVEHISEQSEKPKSLKQEIFEAEAQKCTVNGSSGSPKKQIELFRENSHAYDNDSYIEDYDDNTSITDVTNELLSLTYENSLLNDSARNHTPAVQLDEQQLVSEDHVPKIEEEQPSLILQDPSLQALDASQDIASNVSEENPDHIPLQDTYQISIKVEDPEDDVRSLYPDVVVISSSEEEIQSRRSSLTNSSVNADFESLSLHESDLALKDFSSGISSQVSEQLESDVSEEVKTEFVKESGDCVVAHGQSQEGCEEGKVSLSSKGNVPADLPLVENRISEPNESMSSDIELSSPLKNASFVKKLEKIIGDQTLKISPHPPLPKVMIAKSDKSENSFDTLSGSDVPGNTLESAKSVKFVAPSKGTDGDEFSFSGQTEKDTTEDSNPPADIRSKLEKIFSTSLPLGVTSPTFKNNPEQLPISFEKESVGSPKLSAGQTNVSAETDLLNNTESEPNLQTKEMEETKKKMLNVLGTLRLRNQDRTSPGKEIPTEPEDSLHSEAMDETRKRMLNVLGTLRLKNQNQSSCS